MNINQVLLVLWTTVWQPWSQKACGDQAGDKIHVCYVYYQASQIVRTRFLKLAHFQLYFSQIPHGILETESLTLNITVAWALSEERKDRYPKSRSDIEPGTSVTASLVLPCSASPDYRDDIFLINQHI